MAIKHKDLLDKIILDEKWHEKWKTCNVGGTETLSYEGISISKIFGLFMRYWEEIEDIRIINRITDGLRYGDYLVSISALAWLKGIGEDLDALYEDVFLDNYCNARMNQSDLNVFLFCNWSPTKKSKLDSFFGDTSVDIMPKPDLSKLKEIDDLLGLHKKPVKKKKLPFVAKKLTTKKLPFMS